LDGSDKSWGYVGQEARDLPRASLAAYDSIEEWSITLSMIVKIDSLICRQIKSVSIHSGSKDICIVSFNLRIVYEPWLVLCQTTERRI
jgi:hypothetical protein